MTIFDIVKGDDYKINNMQEYWSSVNNQKIFNTYQ